MLAASAARYGEFVTILTLNKTTEVTGMKNQKVLFLTQGAVIAALYVVLCQLFAPISFRDVQVRIAEGLTILPYFTPAAVPGLFIGCIICNILGGAIVLDVVFGSMATLLGALGTWAIGKAIRKRNLSGRWKYTLPIPPIVLNMIIVPLVLYYGYGINVPIPIQMLTVGLGEVISCGVIGMILLFALEKAGWKVFHPQGN
jgi:uncharacterized membrane protein